MSAYWPGRGSIERSYQWLFESAGVGIVLLEGASFRVLDMNRAACKFLQQRPEDLMGRSFSLLSSRPEELDSLLHRAVATIPQPFILEIEPIGTYTTSFIAVLTAVDPENLYSCSFLPWPEEKSGDEHLLSALLQLSPDPMFILDDQLRYTHFFWGNAPAFGVNTDQLRGATVYALYPYEIAEREQARFQEAMNSGVPIKYQSRVHIQGSDILFSTVLIPIQNARGEVRGILGVSRDITEQEREKNAATRLEKEMEYRKGFVMTAAHELRTPLQPILGYLHLLLDDPSYFGLLPETEKMLRICLDNVERERHIVNRMLELSLLYAEKFRITPRDVDLASLVDEILRHGEYGHAAEIEVDIPEPAHLTADRDCLYTVLETLISNAIRFNNPPRTVRIRYRQEQGHHTISVADNGVGISPSALHAIFEPFHLVDAEKLSRQYNRMGLALSIARKYIYLHGGTIQVESEVGIGSTFTVRIPEVIPNEV